MTVSLFEPVDHLISALSVLYGAKPFRGNHCPGRTSNSKLRLSDTSQAQHRKESWQLRCKFNHLDLYIINPKPSKYSHQQH